MANAEEEVHGKGSALPSNLNQPALIRILRRGTNECRSLKAPRRCIAVLDFIRDRACWGEGEIAILQNGEEISCLDEEDLQAGNYVFTASKAAARGKGTEGAGASGDVEMPDVDYGRAAGTRQTGAAAGPSGDTTMHDAMRGEYRRRSDDDDWNDSVDEEVTKILERAFVSPEKNGQPKLDLRPPPPSNPCARRDVPVTYFRNSPSLLLTKLPERNEPGLTNAQTLLAEIKQLHASGKGQDQVQTRATALIGPSGGGKSRTVLEASCHEYSFYLSFSTEKEPGTNILRQAINRLRERHRDEYASVRGDASGLQEFRDNRLHDMEKFISRILLAFALGLREYLRQHRDQASPKGFLLFQLIGISISAQEVRAACSLEEQLLEAGVQTSSDASPFAP
ncbi:hypothetical protein KFL_014140010 [Klebsormidium nitens]|uniref:Uncharacterized protein n=1 Tax=Klebsormidium nitens TaxID=105231 RepID=A0A1Y1IRH2_KLENI|nr:hypothetical protein KFL_014140010 [Klebsormidium nitens]|eukprot:GAQ93283.1 hypothetical protein KFL_014140010 [Klebsormidium nitens]